MELEEYKFNCVNCNDEFTAYSKNAKYCCDWCRNDYNKRLKKEKKKLKGTLKSNKNTYEELVRFKVTEIIERGIEGAENWRDKISLNYSQSGFTDKIKEKVLNRDGFECQVCGKDTKLEIHHIVKRKCGGSNNLDNLIVLCTSCHRICETLDIDRAVRKCTKSAEKYLAKNKKIKTIDHKLILEDTEYRLNRIYSKLSKIDHEDIQEILIELDEVITSIE